MLPSAEDPVSSILRRRETLAAGMQLLALALLYYIGVRIGFAFTLAENATSLLWPPNAILLAALLLCPPRAWLWPLLAVLPAHLIAELAAGAPLSMTSAWYVSNASEALLGAAIIRGLLGAVPRFDRVRDVSVYLLAAVVVAPVLTSFLDAAFVAWVGWRYDNDYWNVVRMRVPSNALAAIIVPPFLIFVLRDWPERWRRVSRAQWLEAVAILVALGAVSVAAFHETHLPAAAALWVYAPLPVLIWATVRVGAGGVSACIAVLALLSITGTLRGVGPFTLAGPETSVLSLQVFLIITASTLMLLAAALAELRNAGSTALRREQRLDLALNAAQMGAWEWDLPTDTFSWRLAGAGGVRSDTASAADLLTRVHPNDRGRMVIAMRAAREGGGDGEVECRFLCGGHVRWIRALGKVQTDSGGRPVAMIGVCNDTTERKHEEMQQRSQREKLVHLARSATLGEASAAITHELSQPLAAILINTRAAQLELRKAQPDMQELGAILDDIAVDDGRAAEVISRLRELFPRKAGEMEQVQIAECIQGIVALEHSGLVARNVTVHLSIDAALPPVIATQAQLQQVLLNLIVNACEAMAAQSGERRLHIAARHEAGEIQVAVRDNGCGVEDFEHIFKPFVSTRTQGVGLGLSIARSIVAAHGGRLWGANNAEGGATFYIALPASAAA